jgi:hypothetical protein
VKALHITELRDAINTLRLRNGLPAFSFGSAPTAGLTEIQAAHITELRAGLKEVYDKVGPSLGLTPPTYTNLTIVPKETTIEKAHIEEIRSAVRGVE